jgi:PAT family beta-lactamase induction signal transducer AmpG
LLQGVVAGLVTAIGCFGGGWLCEHYAPRTVYAAVGVALALVAFGMAVSPATVAMYVAWNLVYSFVVGLAYAAFTAVVLDAIGKGSAATKYNLYATLSNFPIWWVGLVLGSVADRWGAPSMLLAEAALGLLGVGVFGMARAGVARMRPAAA